LLLNKILKQCKQSFEAIQILFVLLLKKVYKQCAGCLEAMETESHVVPTHQQCDLQEFLLAKREVDVRGGAMSIAAVPI